MTEPNDPPPPALPAASGLPDVGRLVDGRYLLGEVIGVGGMATVHRAQDTKLDRSVAIKLLRREVIEDPDIAMRFRREALAATVLRHPNIVACLETGTDDGQPYLVMELIEGEDLTARLKRAGRLAPAEAARIGLDVARALGVAHVRGIVHRDVKPGNILLARDGRAMVTDFGIARLAADAEGAVPGTTLGSVHYFSPEQAKGETTTPASDVYSLGLVLYECLTGQRAWSGDTTAALASVRIDSPAPSPRAIRHEVPAAFDAVVMRALDPEPARRYANGNAIAAVLEPLVLYPDPTSSTVSLDRATLAAGAAGVAAGAAGHAAGAGAAGPAAGAGAAAATGGSGTTTAPPLRPSSPADDPAVVTPVPVTRATRTSRRGSPAIAGPLAVLLIVVAVVAGGLFVASLPGPGDPGLVAVASPTPRTTAKPSRRPTPTPEPTATPDPTPTPEPTPEPKPTKKPAPGSAADLCEPIFGLACGLDRGRYQPSTFSPTIRFDLGQGWSTVVQEPTLIALSRDQGVLTIASRIATVYPSGSDQAAPTSVQALIETFIGTDGVAAGEPDEQRIAKRKATVVELAPTGPDRVPLFGTGDQTFFLEPHGTTRVFVIDGKDGPLIVTIEPVESSSLESVLPAGQKVVESLTFR